MLFLEVKVFPSSGKSAIQIDKNGRIRCYVKASAERGQANREVVRLLARKCGILDRDVLIKGGLTGRKKYITLDVDLSNEQFLELCSSGVQKKLFLLVWLLCVPYFFFSSDDFTLVEMGEGGVEEKGQFVEVEKLGEVTDLIDDYGDVPAPNKPIEKLYPDDHYIDFEEGEYAPWLESQQFLMGDGVADYVSTEAARILRKLEVGWGRYLYARLNRLRGEYERKQWQCDFTFRHLTESHESDRYYKVSYNLMVASCTWSRAVKEFQRRFGFFPVVEDGSLDMCTSVRNFVYWRFRKTKPLPFTLGYYLCRGCKENHGLWRAAFVTAVKGFEGTARVVSGVSGGVISGVSAVSGAVGGLRGVEDAVIDVVVDVGLSVADKALNVTGAAIGVVSQVDPVSTMNTVANGMQGVGGLAMQLGDGVYSAARGFWGLARSAYDLSGGSADPELGNSSRGSDSPVDQ